MEVRCRTSIAGMPKVEGYLEKRGKFNLRRKWKKYWFVLDGKSLLYFKSKESYEALGVCKGMIDFGRVQAVKISTKLKRGFPFEIVTRSQVIYLSTSDSTVRDIWIEELRHALAPCQISDPFNASRVSAPRLSRLFDQVSADPKGSVEKKNPTETAPAVELSKCLEENNTNVKNPKDKITPPINENNNQEICMMKIGQSEKVINSQNPADSTSLIKKDLDHTNLVTSENTSLEPSSEENNTSKQHTVEESDETDEGNTESNYETADETLENDSYFDEKSKRQSFRLPYPAEPEFDLLSYCELKDIISTLERNSMNPSINKLGKSVAVEALKTFLYETENHL